MSRPVRIIVMRCSGFNNDDITISLSSFYHSLYLLSVPYISNTNVVKMPLILIVYVRLEIFSLL